MKADQLTKLERTLLIVPLLGSLIFGILPFFAPELFAYIIGYTGNYRYIYQIAGAANLGYLFALYVAVFDGNLRATRFSINATLAFNLAAIYVTVSEMIRGRANPAVYMMAVLSVIIVLITIKILRAHPYSLKGKGSLSAWAIRALNLSILSALIFGIVPLIPRLFIPIFGYGGVDAGILKIAGAATLGYAVMGIYELKSKVWDEIEWPLIMGTVFNVLAFIASIMQLSQGVGNQLVWLVTIASGFFSISFTSMLLRKGR